MCVTSKRKKTSFLFISLPGLSNGILWSINELKQGLIYVIYILQGRVGGLELMKAKSSQLVSVMAVFKGIFQNSNFVK